MVLNSSQKTACLARTSERPCLNGSAGPKGKGRGYPEILPPQVAKLAGTSSGD